MRYCLIDCFGTRNSILNRFPLAGLWIRGGRKNFFSKFQKSVFKGVIHLFPSNLLKALHETWYDTYPDPMNGQNIRLLLYLSLFFKFESASKQNGVTGEVLSDCSQSDSHRFCLMNAHNSHDMTRYVRVVTMINFYIDDHLERLSIFDNQFEIL